MWRSLRFGDNLQAWLEQTHVAGNDCPQGKSVRKNQ
ncbi:hypothetical protein ACVXHA_14325 [Escherichia coli]